MSRNLTVILIVILAFILLTTLSIASGSPFIKTLHMKGGEWVLVWRKCNSPITKGYYRLSPVSRNWVLDNVCQGEFCPSRETRKEIERGKL